MGNWKIENVPITAIHLDKNDGAVDLSALVMTTSNKQPKRRDVHFK